MRRIAWTRLWALALAVGLVVHAAVRALAQMWLGEAAVVLESVAALLLVRSRTRPAGVALGAASASLAAAAAVLSAEIAASVAPALLACGALMLARHIDRERNGSRVAAHLLRRYPSASEIIE